MGRLFFCKGNLGLLRKSLKLAKGDPKKIYKQEGTSETVCTHLAKGDPKRII